MTPHEFWNLVKDNFALASQHAHPDKKYSFEIRYNGYTGEVYIYKYDSVDENDVYTE